MNVFDGKMSIRDEMLIALHEESLKRRTLRLERHIQDDYKDPRKAQVLSSDWNTGFRDNSGSYENLIKEINDNFNSWRSVEHDIEILQKTTVKTDTSSPAISDTVTGSPMHASIHAKIDDFKKVVDALYTTDARNQTPRNTGASSAGQPVERFWYLRHPCASC